MTRKLASLAISLTALFILAGCGDSTPEAPKGAMRPPDAPATNKIPSTKEEKIAAIMQAPIPKEQKDAAIAKVNAGN